MKKEIYICKYCKRELPNKNFRTKDGCIWCDSNWYCKHEEENK